MVRLMFLSLSLLSMIILSVSAQNRNTDLYDIFEKSTKSVIVLQDFDVEEGGIKKDITWTAKASRFITQTNEKQYPQLGYLSAYPSFLGKNLMKENKEDMKVLALRAAFNKKEYNFVDVFPFENRENPLEVDKEGNAMSGIYFSYPVFSVGMYVWSQNRPYTLEVEFETAYGEKFVVSLGSLAYNGWKVLSADIPVYYYKAQDLNSVEKSFLIKINKMTIWTSPASRVDDFIFYFDNIFVERLVSEYYYEGNELSQKEVIDTIEWNNTSNNVQQGQ